MSEAPFDWRGVLAGWVTLEADEAAHMDELVRTHPAMAKLICERLREAAVKMRPELLRIVFGEDA